jgi:large subunit ribosomal protein L23
MSRTILIKPLITEKAEMLSEDKNQFSFIVDKRANKIEIRKAVEGMYSVNVQSVNTLIMPAKQKNRSTRSGVLKGRKSAFKKAIVTLADGETIDHFGDL